MVKIDSISLHSSNAWHHTSFVQESAVVVHQSSPLLILSRFTFLCIIAVVQANSHAATTSTERRVAELIEEYCNTGRDIITMSEARSIEKQLEDLNRK